MTFSKTYLDMPHDRGDPDYGQAVFLDTASAFDPEAMAAMLRDQTSLSRRRLFPIVRVLSAGMMAFAKAWRLILPRRPRSSKFLHDAIRWGLRNFASPETNFLILRHFHLGSEVLRFIADNVEGVEMETSPLRPLSVEDVKDDLFLVHDLNLYNFVITLNTQLRDKGLRVRPRKRLDFSAISDTDIPFQSFPQGRFNKLDLRSAVELYVPLFAFFLDDKEFRRSANSLQLDETVARYVAILIGKLEILSFVHNKHPHLPETTMSAGWRLMLHGMDTEALHGVLRRLKAKQQAQEAGDKVVALAR